MVCFVKLVLIWKKYDKQYVQSHYVVNFSKIPTKMIQMQLLHAANFEIY